MASDGKLYIQDLTTKTRKGYLCVRVMRKWNYTGNIPGGTILYTGLVLTDEQGKSIYAQIPECDVERLSSALELYGVYTIRKFSVRICRPNYVPFDADFMIYMTSYTTITPSKIPEAKFPNIVYNITAFKDIRTVGSATTKYIDVLGTVVSEDSPRTIYVKGTDRMSPLKEVTIQDLNGTELTATLWDGHVDKFHLNDPVSGQALKSAVVLFCGCLPKKIFNKTQVNVGNASCWFINPSIPEAEPFYARFQQHPVEIRRPLSSQTLGQSSVQPKLLEHKTVAEMNGLDPYDFPEQGCRCTVTITEIPADQTWWYMGCELCKKRLWNQGGAYYCGACKWSTAVPLYKLQFTAADATGDARFFCYDVVARQIIRRNCDSLLRVLNNVVNLPEQILRAIGRSFTFTVSLTDQSFQSATSRVYLVDSTLFRPQGDMPSVPTMPALEAAPEHGQQQHEPAMISAHTDKNSALAIVPTVPETPAPNVPEITATQSESPLSASAPETSPSAPHIEQSLQNKKPFMPAKHCSSRAPSTQARKKLKFDTPSVEGDDLTQEATDANVTPEAAATESDLNAPKAVTKTKRN